VTVIVLSIIESTMSNLTFIVARRYGRSCHGFTESIAPHL